MSAVLGLANEDVRVLSPYVGGSRRPRTPGVLGAPAAFAGAVFGEVAALRGDRGARDVVRRDPSRVRAIALRDAALDVDRPTDLARIRLVRRPQR